MSLRSSRVLVTGAGGFIGSHLVERLVQEGAETKAFVHYNSIGSRGWLDRSTVRNDVEVEAGDVRDSDALRRAIQGVDVVFHLAALIGIPYSYKSPLAYVHTNIEGTANVLQASVDGGVNLVVHTSTSEVYGSARYLPIDENHPLQAQSPYSASKIGADKLAESFYLSFGLPVATIRPFNTFGPRQSARAAIPTIITQALSKSEIRLGNIKPTRDFNFVDDTVEGFIRTAESPGAVGQVTNIGSGNHVSIGELAKTILRLMGRDLPVVSDSTRVRPENSEVDQLQACVTRAQNVLGWHSRFSLDEGLTKTISWIEDNLNDYRVEAYTV